MQYADWDYYLNEYKGTLIASREEFESLAVKATAYINKITFGRAKTAAETAEVKNAVCAVCEVYQKLSEREGVASENNDGYSVSYSQESGFLSQSLSGAARLHLPAELLYQGVDA